MEKSHSFIVNFFLEMTISGGIRKYSYLFMSWRICGFIDSSPCFLTFVHVRYKVLHTIRNEIIILAESFLSKTNELHIIFCLLVPEPYTYYVIELFSLLRTCTVLQRFSLHLSSKEKIKTSSTKSAKGTCVSAYVAYS